MLSALGTRWLKTICYRQLLTVAFLWTAVHSATLVAQPLLSGQELTAIDNWLDSPEALAPERVLSRAMLQHYRRSSQTLDFVTDEGLSPDDRAIALSVRAVQCRHERAIPYCDDGQAARDWAEADADNLPPYLLLMRWALDNDDDEAALSFLQQGLTANRVTAYYFEKFMVLRANLRSMRFLPARRNFVADLVVVPSLQEIYGSLRSDCLARVDDSMPWRRACLELADRLETGSTFYANVLGADIRRDVTARTSTDEQAIAAARAQRESYDEIRVLAREMLDWWLAPGGRPEIFYRDSLEVGELGALRRALESADASR